MVESLRDLGYDFPAAIADLIDNSLTAGASVVSIDIVFRGARSWVRIIDNGRGMSPERINEALRYGSAATYGKHDLGKFGLGLKTASMSQCRRLTVVTRSQGMPVSARRLDLDRVARGDRWEIEEVSPRSDPRLDIPSATGTAVVWDRLDRVLQYKDPASEWARSGLRALAERTDEHLGMVLHRFIDGSAHNKRRLRVTINGTPIDAWDPFAGSETATREVARGEFALTTSESVGVVRYVSYILPPREMFSSEAAFRRAGGPRKWNRQQGFYVYRADRMIQSGGWSWMRTADEHTKLARMSIDFLPELDSAFGINVAKIRVTLPSELKEMLAEPVASLAKQAQLAYRAKQKGVIESGQPTAKHQQTGRSNGLNGGTYASALASAARKVSEERALRRIAERVRIDSPEVARDIGW